jgi:hypothetical protein
MTVGPDTPDHIKTAASRVRTRLPRELVEHALTLYDAGWPPAKIRHELYVQPATLHGWRTAAGLPPNGTVGHDKHADPNVLRRTEQLYATGLTMAQVAAEMNVPEGTVHTRLRAAGANIRRTGFPPGTKPSGLPDGWLTTTQAAERTGLSQPVIKRRCTHGQIPGARRFPATGQGHRVLWGIPEDAIATIRRRRAPRTADTPRDDLAERRAAKTVARKRPHEIYLPAGPFVTWVVAHRLSKAALFGNAGLDTAGHLGAIMRGQTPRIGLTLADRIVTANDARLDDVWPDLDTHLKDAA